VERPLGFLFAPVKITMRAGQASWKSRNLAMQRPTSVLVFGILNLVFGALGLCGAAWSLAMFMGPFAKEMAKGNPVLQKMQSSPAFGVYSNVSAGLGFVFTLVLLAAGVGLLRMRPWGRTASIAYAVYGIVASIVGAAVVFLFILGPMLQEAEKLPPAERAAVIGGVGGGVLGACFGMVYPILLLVFMFRENVVAAFAAAAARGEDRLPPDGPFETGNPYQSR
jgi:hypothetical protein